MVLRDTTRAENYETTKAWLLSWNAAGVLYNSSPSPAFWEGTSVPRAAVPFFTVATAVNSVKPQVMAGMFFDSPPFSIQERPGTTADAAKAIGDVIAYQLDDMKFKSSLEAGVVNSILYGTAIFKYGWETFTKERTVYKRKDNSVSLPSGSPDVPAIPLEPDDEEIEVDTVTETIDRPVFDNITNLRHVLVDPTLQVPDIQKAKFVVHRMYMTFRDLDKLRDRPGYKIPSQKELLMLFFPPRELADAAPMDDAARNSLWDMRSDPPWEDATVDPFSEPLEVLERWDNETVTVVLQKKLVILNDKNPYGCIPYFNINWWDVPEGFYGMGLAKTIGSEQRLQQGLTNTYIDNATLNLQGVYTRVRGKSVPVENIRIAPGRIVNVENKDDFQPLQRTPPVPEATQHIAMSQARVEQTGAVSEIASQGVAGSSGHSNLARTAAGANLLGGGASNRISDFVDKLANNVFIPFLYKVHEMNRAMLPVKTIRSILNDELEHAYLRNGGDIIEILNARVKFDILAGSKMAARRTMAQALPILTQFLLNPEVMQQLSLEQKKVDIDVVLKMFFESADWATYYDVIVPMQPEEAQRAQANSPAAIAQMKLQAAQAQQASQYQAKAQLADQEGWIKAGNQVLRTTIEKSAEPYEVSGSPGNEGFGSSGQ